MMLGKQVLPLSRCYSYKELYEQTLNFLKAICDEDYQKAKKYAKKNIRNGQLLFLVIKTLNEKHKLEKEYQILKKKYENIQMINDKFKQQNIKSIQNASKNISEDMNQYEEKCWKYLMSLMKNRKYEEIVKMASIYNCEEMKQIAQQLSEYQWLLQHLGNNTIPLSSKKGENLDISFSPQRSHIKQRVQELQKQKQEINQQLQYIFGKIIDPKMQFKINQKIFNSKVILQLQRINQCFQAFREETSLSLDLEKRIMSKILRQFPKFRDEIDSKSFCSIIQEYVDCIQLNNISDRRLNFGGDIIDKSRTFYEKNDDIQIPTSLASTKSHNIKKIPLSSEQTDHIIKKIIMIGRDTKQLNQSKKDNYFNHLVKILDHIHNWIRQRNIEIQMHRMISQQEDDTIRLLKQFNKKLIQFEMVQSAENIEDEALFDKIITAFFNNLQKLVDHIKNKLSQTAQSQKSSGLELKNSICRDAFISGEYETIQKNIYQDNSRGSWRQIQQEQFSGLLQMDKGQLVKIVLELRKQINNYQQIRMTHVQNFSIVQDKYKKVQKQLKQSMILLPQLCEESQKDKFQIKLKNQNRHLKQQLQKAIESVQIKQHQLRNLEEQIQKEKVKYQKLLQNLEERNLEADRIVSKNNIGFKKRMSCAQSMLDQSNSIKSNFIISNFKDKYTDTKVQKISVAVQQEYFSQQNDGAVSFIPNNSFTLSQCKDKLLQTMANTPPPDICQIDYKTLYFEKVAENQVIQLKYFEKQMECNQIELAVQEFTKTIKVKNILIDQYSQKLEQLNEKYKYLVKRIQQTQAASLTASNHLLNQQLFVLGSIFNQNSNDQRLYLIETLTKFVGPIKKTLLLYRFDPLNKINPHRYIDQHKHIVLIAKTIYGKHVACYSKQPISSGGCRPGFGLMISIWNRMIFEVQKNKRAVTYDEFFIIFGNSELRIKSQENKIFSNFGINNANFNHRGHKVDSFLGEGTDREVYLQSYQVYQLQL